MSETVPASDLQRKSNILWNFTIYETFHRKILHSVNDPAVHLILYATEPFIVKVTYDGVQLPGTSVNSDLVVYKFSFCLKFRVYVRLDY